MRLQWGNCMSKVNWKNASLIYCAEFHYIKPTCSLLDISTMSLWRHGIIKSTGESRGRSSILFCWNRIIWWQVKWRGCLSTDSHSVAKSIRYLIKSLRFTALSFPVRWLHILTNSFSILTSFVFQCSLSIPSFHFCTIQFLRNEKNRERI